MKGSLKNKVLAGLASGLTLLTITNLLFVGSTSYHIYRQNHNKDNYKENDFSSTEEYNEKMAYCDKEIDRVTPIRNGLMVATAISMVGAIASNGAFFFGDDKNKLKFNEDEVSIGE